MHEDAEKLYNDLFARFSENKRTAETCVEEVALRYLEQHDPEERVKGIKFLTEISVWDAALKVLSFTASKVAKETPTETSTRWSRIIGNK
jgi:hypothetical protein